VRACVARLLVPDSGQEPPHELPHQLDGGLGALHAIDDAIVPRVHRGAQLGQGVRFLVAEAVHEGDLAPVDSNARRVSRDPTEEDPVLTHVVDFGPYRSPDGRVRKPAVRTGRWAV